MLSFDLISCHVLAHRGISMMYVERSNQVTYFFADFSVGEPCMYIMSRDLIELLLRYWLSLSITPFYDHIEHFTVFSAVMKVRLKSY